MLDVPWTDHFPCVFDVSVLFLQQWMLEPSLLVEEINKAKK